MSAGKKGRGISPLPRWERKEILPGRRWSVVDGKTGKAVALTQSAEDAERIAALPELIEALEQAWYAMAEFEDHGKLSEESAAALKAAMEIAWRMEEGAA